MSYLDDRIVPAIVVGRGATGLGALRSLVLAGIPAYVACPPGDLVTRSRWYRPVPGAPWDGSIGPHAQEVLRHMPVARAVVIPARDDVALWLADLPHSDLAPRFAVSSSPRASLKILQDKSRFGQFLRGTTMPHPRTFTIDRAADIEALPFDELDRAFIKPADSLQFNEILGVKGVWAENRAELAATWSKLDQQGFKVIVQEYVPGTAADHYFLDGFRDRSGVLAGLFARRRQRIHPADFGNSSYCESVALADLGAAVPQLQAMLASLDYRGIFSAEFKRDARNGELRILEVNTRAWWYVEFAARCGVNVCAMAYQDALGQPVTEVRGAYPVGVGCVNLDADIRAVFTSTGRRAEPLLRTLFKWARAHCHVFRWDDPWPAWVELWTRLRNKMLPREVARTVVVAAPRRIPPSNRLWMRGNVDITGGAPCPPKATADATVHRRRTAR